jgi:hypothetical protein
VDIVSLLLGIAGGVIGFYQLSTAGEPETEAEALKIDEPVWGIHTHNPGEKLRA